jgi:hypothetical protein
LLSHKEMRSKNAHQQNYLSHLFIPL